MKKQVEIYKIIDGSQQCILRLLLSQDGNMIYEFPFSENEGQRLVQKLKEKGIKNYDPNATKNSLYPVDGMLFLQQLKNNFHSGYLNATEIMDVE